MAKTNDNPLKLPAGIRAEAEQVIGLTDGFCAEHLDDEYGALCRKLVAKLARKRPSPLERGDLRTWAAAVLYTIGRVNFLFDRAQRIHMTGDQLSALTGVPKSTMTAKSKLICDALRIGPLDPQYCRREFVERNPLAWLVQVNGFLVDARTLPAELQAEARRRGLIPDLPPQKGE